MQLVLDCPSGIAGNLWLAALLGLGADPNVLSDLPASLGLPATKIEWRHDPGPPPRSEVDVVGTMGTPATDYEGLQKRIRGAALAPPVRADALAVLHAREEAEARFLGLDLNTRLFSDQDVADTLIDVVGGVLLAHALGRPRVVTGTAIVVGSRPRSSAIELLAGVPTEPSDTALDLVTPTGAALLRAFWDPGPVQGSAVREVLVPGDFSTAAGLAPLHAALHDW